MFQPVYLFFHGFDKEGERIECNWQKWKTKVASSRNTNVFTLRQVAPVSERINFCDYYESLSHDKRNCDTFHKFTDLARKDTELLGPVLTPSCCWDLEADEEEEEADENKFSPHFIFGWFSGAEACASFSGGGEVFKTADPHFELVASWGHPILPDWIASILLQMFLSDVLLRTFFCWDISTFNRWVLASVSLWLGCHLNLNLWKSKPPEFRLVHNVDTVWFCSLVPPYKVQTS